MASKRARKTDPETSHEAAGRLTEDMLTAAQARVLRMFHLYGNMHDAKLVKYLNEMERSSGFTKFMSPSGVRSRRSELSKPNMERLDQIVMSRHINDPLFYPETRFADLDGRGQAGIRDQLRAEGYRSPLIDTGLRVKVDGSNVIVWGLANV